jgi:hypothetical protein
MLHGFLMICSCQAQVVGDINRATRICLSVEMLLLLTGIVMTSSQARWLWSRLPTSASCRSTRCSFYPCLINACMLALYPNNSYTLIIQAIYSISSLVCKISCQQHAIESSARSRCGSELHRIMSRSCNDARGTFWNVVNAALCIEKKDADDDRSALLYAVMIILILEYA